MIAPLSNLRGARPWEGACGKKPWDWPLTCTIAHLETPETLAAVVALLRCQTVRPYLCIVDTGSSPATCEKLEELRAEDLEIHYLKSHAWRHSSQPVAVATDLAFGLCTTEFLFTTHSDCFPRRRDLLEDLLGQCGPETPAVGWQMSPRDHETPDWRGMVSHTCSVFHVPTFRRRGWSWNIERAMGQFAIPRVVAGWPDTETCLGYLMREAGIAPVLLGEEVNDYQVTADFEHCRSLTCRLFYDRNGLAQRAAKVEAALGRARERIEAWGGEPKPADPPRLVLGLPAGSLPTQMRVTVEVAGHSASLNVPLEGLGG